MVNETIEQQSPNMSHQCNDVMTEQPPSITCQHCNLKSPEIDDWDALEDAFSALMDAQDPPSDPEDDAIEIYCERGEKKFEKYMVGGELDYNLLIDDMVARGDFDPKPPKAEETDQGRQVSEFVLADYNANNKDADYKFLEVVGIFPYWSTRGGLGYHINFFAYQSGSECYPVLFFADVLFGKPDSVEVCCLLNPSPISYGDPDRINHVWVYHPPHLKCSSCIKMAEVVKGLNSDDSDVDF